MPVYIRPNVKPRPQQRDRVLQTYAPPRPVAKRPPRVAPNPFVLLVHGMNGLGDNLHQRAIVRRLLEEHTVYLETPWPSVYHDLVGDKLMLVPTATSLRTQQKNIARERGKYWGMRPPPALREMRVWYSGNDVRQYGSIYAAMTMNAGYRVDTTDFTLPIPTEWYQPVYDMIEGWGTDKPILLYRPLVERTEWKGCAGRNPDLNAYVDLFAGIREKFFVVSVADLVPGKEWIVSRSVGADVELHHGELSFESLAALASCATLVYGSAGFAPLMAQAVGTANICIFGGHESSMTIKDGARFAPTLGIDPIIPCNCFDHHHAHKKSIDIPNATARIRAFVDANC